MRMPPAGSASIAYASKLEAWSLELGAWRRVRPDLPETTFSACRPYHSTKWRASQGTASGLGHSTTTVAVADMDHFTFYRRADIAVEAERIRHIYADQQGE